MTYTYNHTHTDNAFYIRMLHKDTEKATVTISRNAVKGHYIRPWGDSTRTAYLTSEADLGDIKRHTRMSDESFDELKSLIESGKRVVRGELHVNKNATSIDIVYRYQNLIVTVKLDTEVVNGEVVSAVVGGYMITSKDMAAQWSGDLAALDGMESYHKTYNSECMPSDVLNVGRACPDGKAHPEDVAAVFSYAGFNQPEIDLLVETIDRKVDQLCDSPIEVGGHGHVIMNDEVTIQCHRDGRKLTIQAMCGSFGFDATWLRYTNNMWVSGTFDVDELEGSDPLDKIENIYLQTFSSELSEVTLDRLSAFIEDKDDPMDEQGPVVGLPTLPWLHNKSGIAFQVEGFEVRTSALDNEPYAIVLGPNNVREALSYMDSHDLDEDDDDFGIRRERRYRRRSSASTRQRKYYLASYNAAGEVVLTALSN